MSVKLTQVSTFFCALLCLLFVHANNASAQVGPVSISGPTTVYGGSTSVYSLVPTVTSSTYVVWTVSFLDGQIISAPPNSSLEGYGINTCYVTWATNVQTAYLTVTLPRNSPIQEYTLRVTRGTGLNGTDEVEIVDRKPATATPAEVALQKPVMKATPLKQ